MMIGARWLGRSSVILLWLVPLPLFGQSSDRADILAQPFRQPVVSPAETASVHMPIDADECDSDWDGAFQGAALGTIPGFFMLGFIANDEMEQIGAAMTVIVGSVAGFWIGLAVDSADCEVREAGSRVGSRCARAADGCIRRPGSREGS